jgi:hypothetical protein
VSLDPTGNGKSGYVDEVMYKLTKVELALESMKIWGPLAHRAASKAHHSC